MPVDQRSPYLKLPLPHEANRPDQDLPRLRNALRGVDSHAKKTDAALDALTDEMEAKSEILQQAQQSTSRDLATHLESDNPHHIPLADQQRAGLVQPGSGLNVDASGVISVPPVTSVPRVHCTNVKDGEYVNVMTAYGDGNNRIATIRAINNDGCNQLFLGAHDEKDSVPAGIMITNADGVLTIDVPGKLNVAYANVMGGISGIGMPEPGDFVFSYNASKPGYLLCNGAAVARTTYAALFSVINVKFGAGDGYATFNLPDMRNRVAQGASGNLGGVLEAGLPNVTGQFTIRGNQVNVGVVNGAIYKSAAESYQNSTVEGGRAGEIINFNASRSCAVYGKSNTVQAPAVALNCFIKY